MDRRDRLHIALDTAVTKAASYAPAAADLAIDRFTELVVTWKITSAERDTGDELYDLYLITGDGLSEWDLVHFPQIAATGAKTYTARISSIVTIPQSVTTAAPGIASNDSATLRTDSGATNAPKSLAAGTVRHGPFGNMLRYELVVAGTVVTGIAYTVQVYARQ